MSRLRALLVIALVSCSGDKDPLDSVGSAGATSQGTGDASTGAPTTGATTDDPTPPGVNVCLESCQSDDDCLIDGGYFGFHCNDGRCVGGVPLTCGADWDCQVLASGWAFKCASQAGCDAGDVCIDLGGGDGRCATVPAPDYVCSDYYMVETSMPPIEGGPEVTVCFAAAYLCVDGYCQYPCESDGDCEGWAGRPHCNLDNGRCECTSDADCEELGVPGFTVCKATFCGCADDAACLALGANADVCHDGVCGCSSSDVCTDPRFDGTQAACQPL